MNYTDYEEDEALGIHRAPLRARMTERQTKKPIDPKSAQYGKQKNGRTGFKDRTTANVLSTKNQEGIDKKKAKEQKDRAANDIRESRKSRYEKKGAPMSEPPFDLILDCQVLGPSSETTENGEFVEYYDLKEDYPEIYEACNEELKSLGE